jgi:hypothetical protein
VTQDASGSQTVTIVSGLPRSGTSMMMRMLEAGGIPVLIDNIREADDDNPRGYYEFERVKNIKTDPAWLEEAKGRVVKMVSTLLLDLPTSYAYRVVFMRRKMEEILASQRQMLIRNRKAADSVPEEKMAALYEKHLAQIEAWIARQRHLAAIYVSYNEMLVNAREQVRRIDEFFGGGLDVDAMLAVIDRTLHRQKKS